LVESAAIYGLVVALLILFTGDITAMQAISAGSIIGAVGIFTCLCESWIVRRAIATLLRNPATESEVKSNMILYVALVESAAIYGLVTSLLIIFA
jgi:F0F1-type ATP synthase membrane subunit c/vacuolar-type H+-ATPase subunit K